MSEQEYIVGTEIPNPMPTCHVCFKEFPEGSTSKVISEAPEKGKFNVGRRCENCGPGKYVGWTVPFDELEP